MKTKMSKIGTIIQHEYITKTRTKGFIIGTFLGPLMLAAVLGVMVLAVYLSTESAAKKIAVIDETNKIGEKFIESEEGQFYLTKASEEELKKKVRSEEIDGYILIPEDIITENEAKLYTRGGGGLAFFEKLESKLNHYVRLERLSNEGISPDVIDLVQRDVIIETDKITEKGVERDYAKSYAWIGYALGFAIYMFMFIYGSFVSRGVIEEKANRIIEVLASSARPFEIMMGKVLGIGLVGLTQILLWIVMFIGLVYLGQPLLMSLMDAPQAMQPAMMSPQQQEVNAQFMAIKDFISGGILLAFVFYFLAGYFMFSTLFAAIGSAVDQEQDAQQLMTPITMLIVIPMLFIGVIMSNPDSNISIILSLVPFFSPILMIARIAATNVPIWQIALSVVLMLGSFLVAVWIAARIYRIGILMYGKKPRFRDLAKWIRTG